MLSGIAYYLKDMVSQMMQPLLISLEVAFLFRARCTAELGEEPVAIDSIRASGCCCQDACPRLECDGQTIAVRRAFVLPSNCDPDTTAAPAGVNPSEDAAASEGGAVADWIFTACIAAGVAIVVVGIVAPANFSP